MNRRTLALLAAALVAGALAALGGSGLVGLDRAAAARPGTATGWGMMGGGGMMGSAAAGGPAFGGDVQTRMTATGLRAVRARIEEQLAGWGYGRFRVAEVMAFTNGDYVLVANASGRPAFELLAAPRVEWLMPEPTTTWNTAYGMMRGGTGPAVGSPLTAAQAKTRADAWLAARRTGESAADATALPGYYTLDVVKSGRKVGMLSVNRTSGAVWYHTWHGSFLAERDF